MTHLAHQQRTWSIRSKSFPLFSKLSSQCPKSEQITNKIKVSCYEPTISPSSSIPSQIPALSKANLSSTLTPHHLLSPGSLAPSIHYPSDSHFAVPPSSLSANIQVTSMFKISCFSIVVTAEAILASFYPPLPAAKPPAAWLPLCQQAILYYPRAHIWVSKDRRLEERIGEK